MPGPGAASSNARRALLCLAIALPLGLAGCGSNEEGGAEIPQESADAMLASVSTIRQATASRQCEDAQAATNELRDQVDALPTQTDEEITEALGQMVSRLDEELDAECVETGPTGEDEEETTTTTEPVEPTAPETTAPETTTEEPPPEEEEEDGGPPVKPPGQDGSQGPPEVPPGQAGGGPPSGGIEGEE